VLAVRAEDARIDIRKRRRQPLQVVLRCGNRHVEISRQALRTMRLNGDASNRYVLDAVTRERLEQLARMEGVAVAH